MGTGSVTHLVFTRVFGLSTVPVPFFGRDPWPLASTKTAKNKTWLKSRFEC